jgi:AcrR family transcriptional regulator
VGFVTSDGSGEQPAALDPPTTWRELAVSRSLDAARMRAENRVQRFLDAALELINDSEVNEFTVQEVVERSGQSLRSFYQYFGGKHELQLALFEESVQITADLLRERVAREGDPLERLRRFVVEYFQICRSGSGGKKVESVPAPIMVEFAQRLLTAHPAEAARAYVPLVSLFDELLREAVEAGAIRDSLSRRSIAGTLLEVVMFNVFSATIGGVSLKSDPEAAAEDLWDLILNGIGTGKAGEG